MKPLFLFKYRLLEGLTSFQMPRSFVSLGRSTLQSTSFSFSLRDITDHGVPLLQDAC